MRKALFLLACLAAVDAFGCTNFIVGKEASADGSVICTYNADDYGMFQSLCHYPAAKHAPGEMRRVVDWDTNEYHGDIPEAPETYNVIGNINEFQVTIGETTYGGREEMVDSTGILDYGSLIYITLQRSKTAREAIKVMTTLVETYGYNSEGETFTICDPNEAWIMEMMGMGPGSKSAVWVAIRIPDNAICAHANQSRITTFDMKDKNNVLYSKNVVKYARKMGWYEGKDADFSWNAAYAAPDFSGRRFCEARVWSFFNHFTNTMDRYLPYAMGKVANAEPMPLWIVPDHKVRQALIFVFIYFLLVVIAMTCYSLLGADVDTALGSSISMLSNVGPATGATGPASTFANVPALGKWLMSAYMLIGRLEIFTVLFLLMPNYWKDRK